MEVWPAQVPSQLELFKSESYPLYLINLLRQRSFEAKGRKDSGEALTTVPVGGVMGSCSIKNVWQSQSPLGLLALVPLLGLGYNLGD